MTINTLPVSTSASPLALASFEKSADRAAAAVVVLRDGVDWKIGSTGVMTKALEGLSAIHATSVVVETMGQNYSSISQPIEDAQMARGLGPGQPLEARTVRASRPIDAVLQSVNDGVDFMTQLMFSAVRHGTEFNATCSALGLSAQKFDAAQRQEIDGRMQASFDAAAAQGQSPVDLSLAQQWLRSALTPFMVQASVTP